MTDRFVYKSPAGPLLVEAEGDFLTGLWFETEVPESQKKTPVIQQTVDWLDAYFEKREPGPLPPVHLAGTDFQLKVWEILQTIPYGKTTTYKSIARAISPTMSAQAVGQAVGKNPVSILIPCHRVIGSNGRLTGYAGGLDKKTFLLELEGIPHR